MKKILKPEISSDFTVDDIHKIRAFNYERRKNMTFDEYKKDVQKSAAESLKRINAIRANKGVVNKKF